MRLILFGISLLALLLIAAVIGPSFVDWNKYKPQIVTQVKNATGLDVKVDGDLSMSVLPSPRVKIEDLTIISPRKIQFENLLTMKSAEVRVELVPLFSKKIVVDSVTLIEPVIQIEMMADGTPSWETDKLKKAKNVSDVAPTEVKQGENNVKDKALDAISLNELSIEKGTLSFIDHGTKKSHAIKDMTVDVVANSLKGPFKIDGVLTYNDKKIEIDAKSGKLPAAGEAMNVNAEIGLPDVGASVVFGGLTTVKEPYDVQGQTTIKAKSVQALASQFGAKLGKEYDQSLMLDGLLTADQSKLDYNDLKFAFGDFIANGKISVNNIKARNPMRIVGDLKSTSVLDLNPFLQSKNKKTASLINKAHAQSSKGQKKLLPDTITFPADMNVIFKTNLGGVKIQDHVVKGLFVDVAKSGSKSGVTFKALNLPGQGKAEGALDIVFGSSSVSSKGGQVTYSDPNVSYTLDGQIGQIGPFLNAFAPKMDTKAITKLHKTAQFNLKGDVRNTLVSMKDSVLKLDQMVLGLGGRYEPALNGGRPKATIDVTAGTVDFDKIAAAQGKKPAAASGGSSGGGSGKSVKESLKPVQEFSLPMDLGFDLSMQKARINNADLDGVRLTGGLIGNKLSLKNASVNSYAGASMALKGTVTDLSKLSGLDLELFVRTANIQSLAQALKVDTSKFPKDLKALEASVTGKGALDKLNFNSNIKAMGGQLDASGVADNVADKPSFSNLTVRLKHPNLVQAIQIVSPEFKGATGLNQPVDFYTQASSSGKVYTLSGMKTTLGSSSFTGDIKVDTGSKVPSIRGSISAGRIELDKLLGAKTSSSSSIQGSGGSSSASSGSSTSARWSDKPINLDWMNTIDVDVNLSAASIKYGGWDFNKPSTNLRIAGGVMTAKDMKAVIFGGQGNLDAQVNAKPVSVKVASTMDNVDLEALAKAISTSGKLKSSGRVSFNMDVAATGASSSALINNMNGNAALNGTDVILKGFDLAKMARGLAVEEKLATSVTSLIDGATKGGQTQFDTIKGTSKITNGIANIENMILDGPSSIIKTTGYADFPKWFINLDNEIMLKDVQDLEPFNVKIKGPLNNPSDTFGKNILEDYLGSKIKRKIGKELPGLLGDDVTNKLEKFGIIPKQQAPAPAPAPEGQVPANDNVSAPAEQQAPAQEKPATEEQPKKDPLQQILENPNDAEDAIKGVLDGFLQ